MLSHANHRFPPLVPDGLYNARAGDILLLRSWLPSHKFTRWITGSQWSEVAMFAGEQLVGADRVPVVFRFGSGQRLRVEAAHRLAAFDVMLLRATALMPGDKARLVSYMLQRVGVKSKHHPPAGPWSTSDGRPVQAWWRGVVGRGFRALPTGDAGSALVADAFASIGISVVGRQDVDRIGPGHSARRRPDDLLRSREFMPVRSMAPRATGISPPLPAPAALRA